MLLAALSAILLPLILLAGFRLPARIGMSIAAVIVAVVALTIWQVPWPVMAASGLQALHRALAIGLILLGAVALLYTVERTGAMARIRHGFDAISSDMRVQVVLVGFLFVSLIEGAAGFGAPLVVVAPVLVALGFRPLAAATLALVGDTVAVAFGAVGTPLLVGLENVEGSSPLLAQQVGMQVTTFDLVIGTCLPVVLIAILVIGFGTRSERRRLVEIAEVAPWALLVGLTYSLSAFMAVRVFGPEFTAIIGALVALPVAMISARYNWLLPNTPWRRHAGADTAISEPMARHEMSLWCAWLPYGVLVLLLLMTRAVPPIKQITTSTFDVSWLDIMGYESIGSTWQMLYSPGTILLLAALIAALVQTRSLRPFGGALRQAGGTLVTVLSALIPTLLLVQIFSNSGLNEASHTSMPIYIGAGLAALFGDAWVAAAPILGMIGAFIAGSSTVSTLTMAAMQDSIAQTVGLPQVVVLALQMIGAAAGNIIAVHNVVAAAAVVGLAHREGLIIRRLLPIVVGYLAIAALLGTVAVWLG